MSAVQQLKEEIPKWTLETDRQLIKAVEAATEQIYTGIKELIGTIHDLDRTTEDCYIRLKHAVNWVSSLSYTKFIENSIRAPGPTAAPPPPAATPARPPPGPEQILAKYKKAIEIAINDLGIKDLRPEDSATVIDPEAAENATMAAGGTYVTPHLRGKLPALIGSKEYRGLDFLGLDVSLGSKIKLTADVLSGLGQAPNPAAADSNQPSAVAPSSVAVEPPPSSPPPGPAPPPLSASAVEENKDNSGRKTEGARQSSVADIVSRQIGNKSTLFGIDDAEPEEPPQIAAPPKTEVLPPPPNIPVPVPPGPDTEEIKDLPQSPVDARTTEIDPFATALQRTMAEPASSQAKRIEDMFGPDFSEQPKEPTDVISIYLSNPQKSDPLQSIPSADDNANGHASVPIPGSASEPGLVQEPAPGLEPHPPISVPDPFASEPSKPLFLEPEAQFESAPLSSEAKKKTIAEMSSLFAADENDNTDYLALAKQSNKKDDLFG